MSVACFSAGLMLFTYATNQVWGLILPMNACLRRNNFGQGFVTSTITTVFTVSLDGSALLNCVLTQAPRLSLLLAWLPSPLGSPQNAGYSFSTVVMCGWRM
jgi:hypothetical protein